MYIYCADVYCDSCGKAICERIQNEGLAPKDPDDQHSYDSDEYPKYVGDGGESDGPQHCGSHAECLEAEVLPSGDKIGALLSTDLTEEGVRYLKEMIDDGPTEVTEFWEQAFSDYL